MKWFNHMLIAGSTCAVVAPPLVPVAILGSTAPDWLESVSAIAGNKVKHRTVTHVLVFWVLGLFFGLFVWDFHGIITAFAFGGLTHILADSLTITGVPLSPFSDRRFHLLGGRIRTGESGEYFISFGIAAVCFLIAGQLHTVSDFFPYFYNWANLYQEGVIDGMEWKQNRFKFI